MTLKRTNIRFPLVASIITLLAVVVMVKLGFWQLDRAQQKQALFNDYQRAEQQSATPINTIKGTPERFQRIAVTGEFSQQRYFLLDNQLREGRPGYHVIALLERADLKPTIAVNLGWVAAPRSRQELPAVTIPAGQRTLTGLVNQPQANVFIDQVFEADRSWPMRVQQFIPQDIAQQTELELAPFLLLLAETEPYGYPRQWQPNVMPPERHHAYALQWFSLAVACLVIFTIAVIKLNKPKKEETE